MTVYEKLALDLITEFSNRRVNNDPFSVRKLTPETPGRSTFETRQPRSSSTLDFLSETSMHSSRIRTTRCCGHTWRVGAGGSVFGGRGFCLSRENGLPLEGGELCLWWEGAFFWREGLPLEGRREVCNKADPSARRQTPHQIPRQEADPSAGSPPHSPTGGRCPRLQAEIRTKEHVVGRESRNC